MNWKKLAPVFLAGFLMGVAVRAVLAAEDIYGHLKVLAEVIQHIEDDYVEKTDIRKVIHAAASGMMRALDPFSSFSSPEVHKQMKSDIQGEFGGIGIRISKEGEWLTVVTPLPGTPAWELGILPGDRIVRIDGEDARDIDLAEAVGKLRGKPGTKVRIHVMREGWKEPKEYEITRANIPIEPIGSVRMLEDGIGYIRLSEFNQKAQSAFEKALGDLKKQGMEALVLDLRNNPGGLLEQAVAVASEFLPDRKLIVYTEGRTHRRQEYRSAVSAPYADLPLAVLINRGTASGAEIVAGAIQDHKRGLLLGTTSFGKASVQTDWTLHDGSGLRLTTAKYYTPSGRSIHRDPKTGLGGILPDILVPLSPQEEQELMRKVFEKELSEMKAKVPGVPPQMQQMPERLEDPQLNRAVEHLKTRSLWLKQIAPTGSPKTHTP